LDWNKVKVRSTESLPKENCIGGVPAALMLIFCFYIYLYQAHGAIARRGSWAKEIRQTFAHQIA